MQSITVDEGQTLIDLTMQGCGDVMVLLTVATLNNQSITDDLAIGNTILTPEAAKDKLAIVAIFGTGLKPASALDGVSENETTSIYHGEYLLQSSLQKNIAEGQTLVDIALQYLGDVTRVLELGLLNEMSITDDLSLDDRLSISQVIDTDYTAKYYVGVFNQVGKQPASAIEDYDPLEGIDFWAIELDFKVS